MKTFLDWSRYTDAGMGDAYADIPKHGGDFAKAVAVCINSRQCETIGKQVMCPSFRITGEPSLSTGGRVRLLKAALASDDPDRAFTEPGLAAAMDLCVSCKGCKRECEANVDMPLIRVEYLAQKRARDGLDLRSRLLAHLPQWLHRAPWARHLVALRNRSPLLALATEKLLRLTRRLPLPVPAPQPFRPTSAARQRPESAAVRPPIVLLVDTFTRYYEPDIAEAAIAVLTAGGYSVETAEPDASLADPTRPLCCGRTYLAQGMVAEARAEAARLVASLKPHVEAGKIVVGLEASCVLGLRDDALALGLGPDAALISKYVLLLEEFLSREATAGRLALPLKALDGTRTLVHGHCHQKATGAMKSMRKVLKLPPAHDFAFIEAGCCGMAGSFGLEAEHVELATQMAELELLPALREAPDATVIANGFSCRSQIRAHGDERPVHLAVFLRDALATKEGAAP